MAFLPIAIRLPLFTCNKGIVVASSRHLISATIAIFVRRFMRGISPDRSKSSLFVPVRSGAIALPVQKLL